MKSGDRGYYHTQFVENFFCYLQNFKYALFELTYQYEAHADKAVGTHLNLLINHGDKVVLQNFIENHSLVIAVKTVEKSSILQMEIYFKDRSMLAIAFIFELRRKGLLIYHKERLIQTSEVNSQGIRVAKMVYQFEYVWLLCSLDCINMPVVYQKFFLSLPEEVKQEILDYMSLVYSLTSGYIEHFFYYEPIIKAVLLRSIKRKKENILLLRCYHKMVYFLDQTSWKSREKKWHTKSKQLYEKYQRKVVAFRHRPAILPTIGFFQVKG